MSLGNNLPRVKVSNQAAIKRIIYLYGPITRLKISKILDLTLPTITTNIAGLLKNGVIKEVGNDETEKIMGRHSSLVDIDPSSRHFIGLELRKPARYACITDYKGHILKTVKEEKLLDDFSLLLHSGAELIRKLIEEARSKDISVDEIGICMPGIVDAYKGILKTQRQYKWFDKPVSDEIAKLTGFTGPVLVENDAASRAIAANFFDDYKLINKTSFAYLYISNGIACPLMHNEPNYMTVPIGPGEIGYMVMEPSFSYNEIGSTGILSEFTGERVIKEICIKMADEGRAPWLKNYLDTHDNLHFRTVVEAQQNRDEGVDEILCRAAKYLGLAIANFDNIVRPETFIIEGKIFENNKNREIFVENVLKNTFRHSDDKLDLIFTTPDDFTGARGAAAVAVQHSLGLYIPGEKDA